MARILQVRDPETIRIAVEALRRGAPVAMPTETVYGLAADATNPAAITAIYEAKGRPRFNPLIAHVCDIEMAKAHAEFSPIAERLAEAFWPGPLTLVLPLKADAGIHELATAGLATVGLRAPQGVARTLIGAFGRPLAAPSANRSGRISPTTAGHVAEDLEDRIDLVLDGGPCAVGVESTIIAVDGESLTLLRPGGVPVKTAEEAADVKIRRNDGGATGIIAPGMMRSHYAPEAKLRLDAVDVRPGEALLKFGAKAIAGEGQASWTGNLSASGDLREAASNLFSFLKQADCNAKAGIAVAPIPMEGIGEAINDRLNRAAAPRD
ncbi:MAG: L-threonylcarbamoyladenylate synthase [Hoeflea sp.]|uniref:L-threonylcarbamoyladenylate synthase n=1 Tax=Hoeflea sp. TaxID=1940281 RepID=UPI0032ED13A3